MSSSDSSSSISGEDPSDRNHDLNLKSIEDQLASTSLAGLDAQEPEGHREIENGVDYASASEGTNHQEIENNDEEIILDAAQEELPRNSGAPSGLVEVEEASMGLGRDGVVWMRTNSELEVDRPSSPSSSGYAGERGSSGASSGGVSGTDEVVEEEIQEDRNDVVDGVLDSQASWIPGKRHVDEVFHSGNTLLVVLFFY